MAIALHPDVSTADHSTGPADAPITLVEYGDFECPYCGMAYPIIRELQRRLGDRLRFVYRYFPLAEKRPHTLHAAQAAEAAAAQGKFWEMHAALFEHQDRLEDKDLVGYARSIGIDATRVARALAQSTYAETVDEHFLNGVHSGVSATPTFFINGERYDGAWTVPGEFMDALERAAEPTRGAA